MLYFYLVTIILITIINLQLSIVKLYKNTLLIKSYLINRVNLYTLAFLEVSSLDLSSSSSAAL